jgi:hypothetical protein
MISFRQHALAVLSVASLSLARPASAQLIEARGASVTVLKADTGTYAEGMRAGIEAANDRNVAGQAILGFVGGVPIGFSALILGQTDTPAILFTAVGVAIVETTWRIGSTTPPRTPFVERRGDAFSRAYSTTYRERLVQRRKKAARLGGVAGAIAGAGLLVLALSSSST